MLNLNNNLKYYNDVKMLLDDKKIEMLLPKRFFQALRGAFVEKKGMNKHVETISDALYLIKNDLIILELKNLKKEKTVPSFVVLIDNKTLQDKDSIFKKIFAIEEGDNAKSSSKKMKMTHKEKVIKWKDMKTEFPLKF
jgi:hypothetical protein